MQRSTHYAAFPPEDGEAWQDWITSADRAILFRLATSARLERAVRAAPFGERLAWRAASRYVAGTTAAAAVQAAKALHDRGVGSSIDLFGEQILHAATAERVTADYLALADQVNALPTDVWLSADLSHLGLDVDPPGCADRLAAIAARLPEGRRIQVGAEDHTRAEAVLACVETVARQGLAGRLGATAQANFRRTPGDLERLIEAGVHVRLVKGAYLEPGDRALHGDAGTGKDARTRVDQPRRRRTTAAAAVMRPRACSRVHRSARQIRASSTVTAGYRAVRTATMASCPRPAAAR